MGDGHARRRRRPRSPRSPRRSPAARPRWRPPGPSTRRRIAPGPTDHALPFMGPTAGRARLTTFSVPGRSACARPSSGVRARSARNRHTRTPGNAPRRRVTASGACSPGSHTRSSIRLLFASCTRRLGGRRRLKARPSDPHRRVRANLGAGVRPPRVGKSNPRQTEPEPGCPKGAHPDRVVAI